MSNNLTKSKAIKEIVNVFLYDKRFFSADCGAANGLPEHWDILQQHSNFIMFEPHAGSYAKLEKLLKNTAIEDRYTIFPKAVFSTNETKDFYEFNVPTGSSLLEPNKDSVSSENPYCYPLKISQVATITLEQVCNEKNIESIDLIKIDVQGAELHVLQGLDKKRIDNLLGIEVESLVSNFYIGQSKLSDIHRYMEQNGFELFDLRAFPAQFDGFGYLLKQSGSWVDKGDEYSKKFDTYLNSRSLLHQIHEIDFIYIRCGSDFISKCSNLKLRHLLVVLCLYGFFPKALLVIDQSFNFGKISKEEHDLFEESVIKWFKVMHRKNYDSPKPFWNIIRRLLNSDKLHNAVKTKGSWTSYGRKLIDI